MTLKKCHCQLMNLLQKTREVTQNEITAAVKVCHICYGYVTYSLWSRTIDNNVEHNPQDLQKQTHYRHMTEVIRNNLSACYGAH